MWCCIVLPLSAYKSYHTPGKIVKFIKKWNWKTKGYYLKQCDPCCLNQAGAPEVTGIQSTPRAKPGTLEMGFAELTSDHCSHWSQSQILHWRVSARANAMSYPRDLERHHKRLWKRRFSLQPGHLAEDAHWSCPLKGSSTAQLRCWAAMLGPKVLFRGDFRGQRAEPAAPSQSGQVTEAS